jgi:ABC-type antimicrobial peptide transport system permease subunit
MTGSPAPTTYFWFPQDPGRQLAVTVRATGDSMALTNAIAAELHRIDPDQPLSDVRAMADYVAEDLAQPRVTMQMLGVFGTVALMLAAIGVYGVMAFAVARRTREIGVRVALGATRRDVLLLLMRRGLLLTGAGIGVGIAAALTLSRVVSGLVFGVAASDAVTLAAASLFLGAVAFLAMYIPARRATRVDPLLALKAQ